MPSSPVAGQPVVRLGRYEILKRLAVGGMAEIFVARSRGLEGFEKIVVLKRIHPALAENPQFVQMFLDEARIAATLQHPNIVQVHDIENIDGGYLFSMEYLHGADLHQIGLKLRQRGHHWPLDVAIGTMLSVTAGLHYAHEKLDPQGRPLGIVHRDVSPQNVLVTYDGVVKLVDFGIAKARGRFAETKGAALKGKVQYMSPEQCRSAPVDRRSDVFAAGILLWELTTGAKLFERESEFASMHAVVDADVPSPRSVRPDYPRALEPIVMKALAREPDARWPTALALHEALSEVQRVERLATGAPTLAKFLRGAMGPEADAWNVARRTGKSLGQHLTEQLTTDDLRNIGVEAEEEETGIRRRIGAIPVRAELLKPSTVELEPEMLAGMLLGDVATTGGEVVEPDGDGDGEAEATEMVSRPPPPPARPPAPPPMPSPPTLPVTAALAPASPSRPLPSTVPTTQLDSAALGHPVLPQPIVPRRPSGSGPTLSAPTMTPQPPPSPPPPVLPVILPPMREVIAAEPAPPMVARSTPPRASSQTMVGGRPVESTATGARPASPWRLPPRVVIALGAMGAGAVAMSALGLKEQRPTPPVAAPVAVPPPSTTPDAARPGPAEVLTALPPDAATTAPAAPALAPADAAAAAAALAPAPDAAKKKKRIRRDEDDEEATDEEEEEDVSAEVSEDGTTPARPAATSPDAAPRPAAKETKKDELETLLP